MEVVTAEDQTRLDVGELRGTTHQLDAHGGSRYPEAVFIVDKNDDERRGEMAGEVEVDTYGSDDGSVKIALRELHPYIRKGILAEAAFAAWQQRLADAADSLNQLTSEDAKIVGPLDVPGRPLITELRADRRRASRSAAVLLGPIGAIEACVDDLIADLRASVRFGAAGFAEAADVHLGEAVQSASDYGGWVDRLRLLIAAEEICAIELLASTERALASDGADDSDSDIVDQLLAKYWSQRQQAEELAALLDDVVDRLPTAPVNPAKRFVRRKALRDVQVLSATAAAYSGVVSPASSPKPDATSWDEAARTLVKLDVVTAAAESGGGGARFDERAAQSIEDAAGWLGELFAQQLQAARTLVDDLARQHPGVDTEGRVQMVKRQTIRNSPGATTRRFPTVSQLKRLSPCWRWRSRSCVESNRTPSQSTRRWVDESSRRLPRLPTFKRRPALDCRWRSRVSNGLHDSATGRRRVRISQDEWRQTRPGRRCPKRVQGHAIKSLASPPRPRSRRSRSGRRVSGIAKGHRRWSSPTHRALRGPILARPKAIAAPLTAAAHSARLNT